MGTHRWVTRGGTDREAHPPWSSTPPTPSRPAITWVWQRYAAFWTC